MVCRPTPPTHRQKPDEVREREGRRDQARAEVQILLEMRGEERVDRVVDDEGARYPPAGHERVEEEAALEDADERHADFTFLLALQPSVLHPNRRLLDELAHIEDRERREDADPQHAAPANIAVKQAVDRAREQETQTPRTLQHAAHEAARARRPLL